MTGKYCAGIALNGACNTSLAMLCDVGLFCNAGSCVALLADNATCNGTVIPCQPNSLCYPDNKCHVVFYLDTGANLTIDNAMMCKTGYQLNLKCAAVPTVTTEWLDNITDVSKCAYSDNAVRRGECVCYSSDPKKTAHCTNFANQKTDVLTAYATKFTAGSCPAMNPYCDKAIDLYGCPAYKSNVLPAYYQKLVSEEALFPACENKPTINAVANYNCFAKELIWGLLTLVAIALLI